MSTESIRTRNRLRPVVENFTQATLLGNIVNKSRLIIINASKVIPADPSELFLKVQAIISSVSNDPSLFSSKSSMFDVKKNYSHFKKTVKWMNQLPLMIALRRIFMVKQTCDFTLALYSWMQGNRSNTSMVRHTVNTALTWVPFMVYEAKLLDSPFALNFTALFTLGCLTYSAFQDFRQYDPKKREKSPTIELIQSVLGSFFKNPSNSS